MPPAPAKRPANTQFKQQRLPAWQPILSPTWVISCFFLVGLVFIPIGVLILGASSNVNELEIRYDNATTASHPVDISSRNANDYASEGPGRTLQSWVRAEVTKEMKAPVYMYYKLTNFYQNHRRYAKSRVDSQLSGGEVKLGSLGDCAPFRYRGEEAGKDEPGAEDFAQMYAPCGLIAWSMFNDSFTVFHVPKDEVPTAPDCVYQRGDSPCRQYEICVTDYTKPSVAANQKCSKDGIAWNSDKQKKFKKPYEGYYSTDPDALDFKFYENEGPSTRVENAGTANELNVTVEGHILPYQGDEDLMVWTRTAALPTFRKLYRIFEDTTFQPGDLIYVRVTDRFDVAAFSGEKRIIFGTTTWIGGKNNFLGAAYIIVGGLCVVLGLVFLVKYLASKGSSN